MEVARVRPKQGGGEKEWKLRLERREPLIGRRPPAHRVPTNQRPREQRHWKKMSGVAPASLRCQGNTDFGIQRMHKMCRVGQHRRGDS